CCGWPRWPWSAAAATSRERLCERLRRRRGRARQPFADRTSPALERQQPVPALEPAVRAAHKAVELPRELLGVGGGVDLPRVLRFHDSPLEAVGPVGLLLEDRIPDRTGAPAVVLLGDGPEEATAWKDTALEVGEPRVAQRPDSDQAARLGQGRAK